MFYLTIHQRYMSGLKTMHEDTEVNCLKCYTYSIFDYFSF
jgi:hypothetical protein